MKNIKKAFSIFAIVSLILIILILPLRLFLYDEGFYHNQFEKNNVNVEQRDIILSNLLNYFQGKEDLSYFNEQEKSHFEDVKNLLKKFFIVFYIMLGLFFISMIVLFFFDKKDFIKTKLRILFLSGLVSFAIIVLFSLAALNFASTFDSFHKIFFSQGNYTFPINSLMIQLFPEEFFKSFFIKIIGFSFVLSLIIMIPQLVYNKLIK